MYVHSATCSCSVELYKQWYTLADFSPNWNFRGVFSIYILFTVRISEAAMGGAGVRGYNMINMTITELYCTFMDFFKIDISAGFSLYNINL